MGREVRKFWSACGKRYSARRRFYEDKKNGGVRQLPHPRIPRLCRARSSVAPPFIRWPAPSQGAGLFCCCTTTDVSRSMRVIARLTRE